MPKRLIMPAWYRSHSHLFAYLALALVAFIGLAREEQLRQREADHFNDVTSGLRWQAHSNCVGQNAGRKEGNQRADALRQSLLVDYRILHLAALRTPDLGDARLAQARADDFKHLADTINDLPPIRCTV